MGCCFHGGTSGRSSPSAVLAGRTLVNLTLKSEKEIAMNLIKKFLREEDGVTAIEYGLIAALIAVAIITIVQTVGGDLVRVFTIISNKLAEVAPAGD
jgi:pilus assembly protein Flp/PilA